MDEISSVNLRKEIFRQEKPEINCGDEYGTGISKNSYMGINPDIIHLIRA